MVIFAELSNDGGGLVDGTGDEVGIITMGSIPVPTVKYADSIIVVRG